MPSSSPPSISRLSQRNPRASLGLPGYQLLSAWAKRDCKLSRHRKPEFRLCFRPKTRTRRGRRRVILRDRRNQSRIVQWRSDFSRAARAISRPHDAARTPGGPHRESADLAVAVASYECRCSVAGQFFAARFAKRRTRDIAGSSRAPNSVPEGRLLPMIRTAASRHAARRRRVPMTGVLSCFA